MDVLLHDVAEIDETESAMTEYVPQRLAALDADDLQVISALVQDAVVKVADLEFDAGRKLFSLEMNRLAEDRVTRRRSVLAFSRVASARSIGIDRASPQTVLVLLALRFAAGEAPSGTLELVFAGDATIALEVECIEARLADGTAAWAAGAKPRHGV